MSILNSRRVVVKFMEMPFTNACYEPLENGLSIKSIKRIKLDLYPRLTWAPLAVVKPRVS